MRLDMEHIAGFEDHKMELVMLVGILSLQL